MVHPNKILCVDDESSILRSLERELDELLDDLAVTLETASSVAQGLELFSQAPETYALVVSDLKMPGALGTELLSQVRGLQPDISTILLTGFSEIEEVKKAIKSGIVAYIQKPWESVFLISEIQRGIELTWMKRERSSYLHSIERELLWTKRIHSDLLMAPATASDHYSFQLAYQPLSSSLCGGDLCLILRNDETHLSFAIGDLDVTGSEGTFYALLIRDLLVAIAQGQEMLAPPRVLEQLNEGIIERQLQLPDSFLNLSVFNLDLNRSVMDYASAGGEAFSLVRGGEVESHHLPSPSLGYRRGIVFRGDSVPTEAGDRWVVSSTGVNLDSVLPEHLSDGPVALLNRWLDGNEAKKDATIAVVTIH